MGRTKLIGLVLALVAFAIGVGIWVSTQKDETQLVRMGVFLYAQHPVISEINTGFRRELDSIASNRNVRVEYIERNADGQAAQANAVSNYFKIAQVNAVFVVGLPAAQALKSSGLRTPVIFGGPPDPVGAGLVPRLKGHATNFTGTRYLPPADLILEVYGQIHPDAKTVAVLHNPGEANSMAVVREFLAAASKRNLQVKDYGASTVTEIEASLRALAVDKPSGLFIPTDNLIHASLDRVLASAKEADVPVFDCTKSSVEKGAIFSVGTDYDRIGALSARVAARVVYDGEPPEQIDVVDVAEGYIYVKESLVLSEKLHPPSNYEVIRVP